MNLLKDETRETIRQEILGPVLRKDYDLAARNIPPILKELHSNIPDDKRISYGIVHTIRVLTDHLYDQLVDAREPVFQIASRLFDASNDFRSRGVALGMLSLHGLTDYKEVLPYFQSAAASSEWDLRELTQMSFRKLIKKWPAEMSEYLLQLVQSEDPNIRRFVAETLRPVQENRWFMKNPDYPLSILRHLFTESSAYPRTSVGNNLSDHARHQPELVYSLVQELVHSGDKNSRWIAYRACRNLVKQDPTRVMNLMRVDEYKYKDRTYKRSDYQGNRG